MKMRDIARKTGIKNSELINMINMSNDDIIVNKINDARKKHVAPELTNAEILTILTICKGKQYAKSFLETFPVEQETSSDSQGDFFQALTNLKNTIAENSTLSLEENIVSIIRKQIHILCTNIDDFNKNSSDANLQKRHIVALVTAYVEKNRKTYTYTYQKLYDMYKEATGAMIVPIKGTKLDYIANFGNINLLEKLAEKLLQEMSEENYAEILQGGRK